MRRSSNVLFACFALACSPAVEAPSMGGDAGTGLADASVRSDGGEPAEDGGGSVLPVDGGEVTVRDAGSVGREDGGLTPRDGGVATPADGGAVTPLDGGVLPPEDAGVPIEDDHANQRAGSTAVALSAVTPGVINYGGDVDAFTFVTGGEGLYQILTTGQLDTFCTLSDINGEQLTSDDNGGDNFNCMITVALPANNRFYVMVRHWSPERVGAYQLLIRGPIDQGRLCGNGQLDEGEACDDGNQDDGDGCDSNCRLEPLCGNGQLDDGEACDDANRDDGDGCDSNCRLEPFCGDGQLDADEECDDANQDDGDGCDSNCRLEPFCGDGQLDADEECDDANQDDGDGCDSRCRIEDVDPPEGCNLIEDMDRRETYRCWRGRTWSEARDHCEGSNMDLVTVDSAADNEQLADSVRFGSIWIGLNDRRVEDEWQWHGRASAYRNWNDGEPNNTGDEDCAEFQSNGGWNDANCGADRWFYCEVRN
jgi:cysteine-rich repeat protein